MTSCIECRTLVTGVGTGSVLATSQTISFWGGVETSTGKIIDPRHELFEQSIAGTILTFPFGKGSAAAPMVLLELVKQGTHPAAIVNVENDPLLVAGLVISKHFYGQSIPVVLISQNHFELLQTGQIITVDGAMGELRFGKN